LNSLKIFHEQKATSSRSSNNHDGF